MKRNKMWFAWCLVMIFLVTSVLPGTLVYANELNEGNKYTINASFNLSKLEPNKLLTATVEITNNQKSAESILGIVALYDQNETMVNVAHISKEIGAKETEHLTAGFKLPSDVDVSTYTARVFVWDGTSIENTNGIPLSNVVELSNDSVSADAFLSALYVDGNLIEGFNTSKEIYTVDLPEGTTIIPTVTATAVHAKANVVITPAAALPGTTVVKVTAENGSTTKEYRITFNVSAPGSSFEVFKNNAMADVYMAADDHKQVVRAVGDLQKDIERVTQKTPAIKNVKQNLSKNVIIAGSYDKSGIIKDLIAAGKLDEAKDLEGKWESYIIKIVENPIEGVEKALVIAGSDARGTIYGVYDVSEQIGVSPWYYWADIHPKVKNEVVLTQKFKKQGEPSVKYRGIFINDEQNLAQWAKLNDPVGQNGGNIGPDTYKKVYELLLRLKANYLWTAMHSEPRLGPSDHFNKYPENRQNADEYGIVVGTSHCEPMMRNGTVEWGEFLQAHGYLTGVDFAKAIGTGNSNKVDPWFYNYNSNNPSAPPIPRYDYSESDEQRAFIDEYWNTSVEAYKDYEVAYTLGMRGLHDDGFRTAKASTNAQKLNVLQAVVDSQVQMLKKNEVNPKAFPIFVPYKEVLPLYELGLKLPEETTIVWAEDNHGFIRRFPTAKENEHPGGNGVYYHVNYVGRQTYTWMNSTPPALIFSEMGKAYESGVQQLWVLNVGDIKPSEIGMEFFLDMAWNINKWNADNLMDQQDGFFSELAQKWFPAADAKALSDILREYYHLNYSRKPEHTTLSESNGAVFDPVNYGDESMQRLADYQDLAERAVDMMNALTAKEDYQTDAFYEIVAYPILGAYYNNLKYYYAQKNLLYSQQGRTAAANLYADMVDWAQGQEDAATEYYNKGAFNGKWDKMMQPSNFLRDLQSKKPTGMIKNTDVPFMSGLGVVAEGELAAAANSVLDFSAYLQDTHFIDVYNLGSKSYDYTAVADKDWVKISEPSGTIYDDQRLFINIDWARLPAGDQTAALTIQGAEMEKIVQIRINNPALSRENIDGYAEANGYVAIETEHYTSEHKDGTVGFSVSDGLGRSGASVSAGPMGSAGYADNLSNAPYLTYQVYFQSSGSFPTTVYRVPTLNAGGQRLAIGVDNTVPVVLNGQAAAEEGSWEKNITNGIEKMATTLTIPTTGYHTIKLYMVDAGVGVDRIVINTGGEAKSNQGPAESYHSAYNTNTARTPKLLSMEPAYLEAYVAAVESDLAALTDEERSLVAGALSAAKVTLANPVGDDAVHRAYARLNCAMAEVKVIGTLDTLIPAACSEADNILLNGGSGIAVYPAAEVGQFAASYAPITEKLESSTLTQTEKLELYIQLLAAMQKVENYRLLKATASSTQSPNIATNVIDGNTKDTRWAAATSDLPQWIEVDLGAPYALDQISITWYNTDAGTRVYKYNVQTSLDGKSYINVVDRSNNTKSGTVSDPMNGAVGRYVRINVTASNGGNASIYEIALTGEKLGEADETLLDSLRQEVEKADLMDGNNYTVDSYAALKDAADFGRSLLSGASKEVAEQALTKLISASASLNERKVVLDDTFENVAALEGWTTVETGGTVTIEKEGDNSFLKIAQTTKEKGPSVEAKRDVGSLTGKIYVEAMVRSDTPQTFFGAPYLYDSTASTTILGAVALRDGGSIVSSYATGSSGMKKIGEFTSNEWVKLCIILDTNTQRMQVYINDKLAAGDLPMRNPISKLGMLRYYSDDADSGRPQGIAYLDNLTVYQEMEPVKVIKIATVGDSLTAGSGVTSESEKYPAQLQEMLGTNYLVTNFGVSGATMINNGTDTNNAAKGYIYEKQYVPSKDFAPDVVVIMLGTNDSKALNWNTMSGSYVDDALALIESYRALDSEPKVYIASSATVVPGTNSFGIQSDVVHNKIVPLQKQIAQIANCGFIDVHEATKNATTAEFPDHVHGNVTGYRMVAEAIYGGITATSMPKASAIVSSQGVSCATSIGQTPSLPVFAPVIYADGTTGIAEVVWDLTGLSFDTVGNVTVPGRVKGLEVQLSAQVMVEDVNDVKAELQQAISDAKLMLAEDFTTDSYYALKTAIAAGEAKLSSGGVSELRAAIVAIEVVAGNLVGRDYIFNDSFDDFANLDAVKAAGWTLVETGGPVTLVTEGSNKYLKLTQTSKTSGTSVGAVRRFDETGGKVYIEARIRQDELGVFMGMPYVFKNGDTSTTANVITSLGFRDTKTLNVQSQAGGATTTPITNPAAGEWMDVCLILDSATQRVKAYVNQVQLPEGKDFPTRNTMSTIDLLRFYTDDVNASRPNAVGYIDNVRVYKEGAKTVNIQALKQAIENAEALNKDDYTIDSFINMLDTVARGKAVVADPVTQDAVNVAVSDIQTAKNSLKGRDYIVNDTFDNMNTINDLPAGWSKVETGGEVTLVTEGSNKYLKLEQTVKEAGKAVEAKRTFGEAGGKIYVEAKVRSDSPETFLGMPYVFKNGDISTTNNIITSLALRDNGDIKVQKSTTGSGSMQTVSQFVYGQWNDVCLILDSDTQKVQAYVNEVHVGKDFPMRYEMSTVDLLRFYSDDSNITKLMAVGYIDDVRIYREDNSEQMNYAKMLGIETPETVGLLPNGTDDIIVSVEFKENYLMEYGT